MSTEALLFMHSATVETLQGNGPTGPVFAAPVTVAGFLDDGLMLTPEAGGEQLVNKTTFFTALANADAFTPGSRFSCNGRSMTIRASRRRDGGALLAAASHLEVDVS